MTSDFFGWIHEETLVDDGCHVLIREIMLSINIRGERTFLKQNKKHTYPVTCKLIVEFKRKVFWGLENEKTNLLDGAFDNIKFITTYYNFLAFIKGPQSVKFWYDPRRMKFEELRTKNA
jgi:hypothetical protein